MTQLLVMPMPYEVAYGILHSLVILRSEYWLRENILHTNSVANEYHALAELRNTIVGSVEHLVFHLVTQVGELLNDLFYHLAVSH